METAKFWSIVDSIAGFASGSAKTEALRDQLLPLSAEQIQEFQRVYEQQIRRASRWDLVAAANLISGHISDDSFRYFCDWLISQGSDTFENALRDPDSLAAVEVLENPDLESFGYAALEAFEAKGAGELDRDFSVELEPIQGSKIDESEFKSRFPKLFIRYRA